MSEELNVIRKIKAFKAGRPIATLEKKCICDISSARTIFISFVRMGGEALPWGIMWGIKGEEPKAAIVADPWVRDDLADTLKVFERDIAKLTQHPASGRPWDGFPFRVVLPNESHLEMLHNIALRYMYAKRGDEAHRSALNRLGRLCNFLFLESQRPGQQLVVTMAELLKKHFAFPADDLRLGHLGFLLALLQTKGSLDERLRSALLAEANPIGISLSPKLERDTLFDLIQDLRDATKTPNLQLVENKKTEINSVIFSELRQRFDLATRSFEFFCSDGRQSNSATLELLKDSTKELSDYFELERNMLPGGNGKSYFRGPKTDKDPISAAINFNKFIVDKEHSTFLLACDDQTIQDEFVSAGQAILGTIEEIRVDVKYTASRRKVEDVFWVINCSAAYPQRHRVGDAVSPVFNPKLKCEIVGIEPDGEKRKIVLEVTPKGQAKCYDFEKKQVVFLTPSRSKQFLPMKLRMYSLQRNKKG